jgi:signal transduction histidine kinase
MKILIIEDEPAIRETLQDILEYNGHTVSTAPDGPTGLAAAADRPDLVLCDIGLPGIDGYEVLAALRQQPHGSEVPFIFLTARADRADQRRGMALGADDYITKPFTERDLLDAIAVRVSRQSRLRARVEQLIEQHRREISADWSHELMTPLTGVLGGLDLIELEGEGISQAELKDLLGLIRAGAERQQRLSRKLVRYFELERVKDAPARAQTDSCRADTVVADAAQSAAVAEKRAQDLHLACEPGEVALAADYLADAVTELVGNALRFSQPGQPVHVTGRRHERRYRIEILDEGPGLPAEQRERIGAFTQFDRNRHEQQGLGLGLAIARAVAEIGGGTLTLDAGPAARGLRVTLELPCR